MMKKRFNNIRNVSLINRARGGDACAGALLFRSAEALSATSWYMTVFSTKEMQ